MTTSRRWITLGALTAALVWPAITGTANAQPAPSDFTWGVLHHAPLANHQPIAVDNTSRPSQPTYQY